MATPASQTADVLKQDAQNGIDRTLSGPLQTVKDIEDQYSQVKNFHSTVFPVVNGAQQALDAMAMSDTTSGNTAGTAAALATIAVNNGLKEQTKTLSQEYGKIKMKLLQPDEFLNTRLSEELDFRNSDFNRESGRYQGIEDEVYGIVPDQTIIDETDSILQEIGVKTDFRRPRNLQ